MDRKVNDEFHKWAEKKHGSYELGHVSVTRGKTYDYLGAILDWNKKYYVGVSMKYYQEAMDEELPEEIKPNRKAPCSDVLFEIDGDYLMSSEKIRRCFTQSQ